MTLKELKAMIETAEDLGYGDARIVLDDSRDGQESYPNARAYFVKSDSQHSNDAVLAFGYE